MVMSNKITPEVLTAATGMLQQFVPELSPENLILAIKQFNREVPEGEAVAKPLTRERAAELLSVSKNTITAYMNSGLLRRIHIGPRIVRIDPQSVQDLLYSRKAPVSGQGVEA